MTEESLIAGIGDNNPPEPIDTGRAVLPDMPVPAGPVEAQDVPSSPAEPELTQAEALLDPDMVQQVRAKVVEFLVAMKKWTGLTKIETAEQSAKLVDFIAGTRQVRKVIDELRKAAKKPHEDRAKMIQDHFAAHLDKMDKVIERAKPWQEDWLKREKVRLEAEKAELRRIAGEEAKRAATDLALAQAAGDIDAEVEAERAVKEAAKTERAAARPASAAASSASGAGRTMALRRSIEAEVQHIGLAMRHFAQNPELQATVIRLAQAEARGVGVDRVEAGYAIPGIKLSIKESV